MEIYSIAGDGNCLFNAIIHQVCVLNPQLSISTSELRSEIVKYIRGNLEDYIPTILDSCNLIYNFAEISYQTESQLVRRYIKFIYNYCKTMY